MRYKWLGFILLMGLLLRLFMLGSEGLWVDECLTLYETQHDSFKESVLSIRDLQVNPPLYFWFMDLWTELFGSSDIVLRIPSVLFSTLAIFLVYLLGKEWSDEKVGLVAATIMCFSMVHVLYSQEARMYSLLTCLVLLSCYFFTRLVRDDSFLNFVFFVLFTVLMAYTHYVSIFVIVILLVFSYFRLDVSLFVVLCIVFCSFCLPLLYFLPTQIGTLIHTVVSQFSYKYASSGGINIFASIFLTRYTHWVLPFVYLYVAWVFVGVWGVDRKLDRISSMLMLSVWLVLTVGLLQGYYSMDDRKEDWRGVTKYLEEYHLGDNVLVTQDVCMTCVEHYGNKDLELLPVSASGNYFSLPGVVVVSHAHEFEHNHEQQLKHYDLVEFDGINIYERRY